MHSTDGIDLSDAISRVASGFLMRSDQRIDDSVAAVIPCGADTRYMPATLAAAPAGEGLKVELQPYGQTPGAALQMEQIEAAAFQFQRQ